jgi:hypothetical protein
MKPQDELTVLVEKLSLLFEGEHVGVVLAACGTMISAAGKEIRGAAKTDLARLLRLAADEFDRQVREEG